jgi:hypothetical protein
MPADWRQGVLLSAELLDLAQRLAQYRPPAANPPQDD